MADVTVNCVDYTGVKVVRLPKTNGAGAEQSFVDVDDIDAGDVSYDPTETYSSGTVGYALAGKMGLMEAKVSDGVSTLGFINN